MNEAQGCKTEALYEYIYHQAWNLLDDNARKVLLVMPMVTAMGTTLEHLTGVTHLSESAVVESLELLTRLSSVNVGGSLDDRRYRIHKLTEAFLNKQVSQWQ